MLAPEVVHNAHHLASFSEGYLDAYPRVKYRADRFMVAELERGVTSIDLLSDMRSTPEDAVTPGRSPTLLTTQ